MLFRSHSFTQKTYLQSVCSVSGSVPDHKGGTLHGLTVRTILMIKKRISVCCFQSSFRREFVITCPTFWYWLVPPLSMGLSRQEYWSGLPFPPPGDRPNPGIEPTSLMSLAWHHDLSHSQLLVLFFRHLLYPTIS